jgi:hypothetical protein
VSTVTLPNWPPARLVRESALAWNLRHPNRKGLDPATSDWPTLCNCVLGFLRHQHSKFDSRLKARQAFHQEYRDELADEILRCARAKYPWLRPEHDPRPFLENGDSTKLVLDARGFQARTDAQYDRSPEFCNPRSQPRSIPEIPRQDAQSYSGPSAARCRARIPFHDASTSAGTFAVDSARKRRRTGHRLLLGRTEVESQPHGLYRVPLSTVRVAVLLGGVGLGRIALVPLHKRLAIASRNRVEIHS